MSVRNIESLESRQLYSATSFLKGGVLRVVGETNAANNITVAYDQTNKKIDATINGVKQSFDASAIKRVIVHGGDLADTLKIAEGVVKRQTVFGYGGNDVIEGLAPKNAGWIRLWGMDGNDKVTSLGGRSFMDGGLGDDTLIGSAANDLMAGFRGNDVLQGLGGLDTLLGGDGSDTLFGGDGNDLLNGGKGINSMVGQGGNDVLDATQGTVGLLFGGDGVDTLLGGTGLDTLVGGGQNDVFTKGSTLNTVVQEETPALKSTLDSLLNLSLNLR